MSSLWLTRPLPDSEAFAATLSDIECIISPVMEIRPLAFTVPERAPDALLIGSRNAEHAVQAVLERYPALPSFCVGEATAQMARAHGAEVQTGSGDMLSLLPVIAKTLQAGSRLLYLSGQEVSVEVEPLLASQQITAERHVVYEAAAVPALSEEVIRAIRTGAVKGACFFSPRSATLANQLLAHHDLAAYVADMNAFCLSLAVAERAAQLPWKRVHACATPTGKAMQELVTTCFPPTVK